MRNFLISGDPDYRAVTVTDDGTHIAFRHAPGGKIDGNNPRVIEGFHILDDTAGISQRSNLPDPTIEGIVDQFLSAMSNQTLPL